jgi:hypothetical protein
MDERKTEKYSSRERKKEERETERERQRERKRIGDCILLIVCQYPKCKRGTMPVLRNGKSHEWNRVSQLLTTRAAINHITTHSSQGPTKFERREHTTQKQKR